MILINAEKLHLDRRPISPKSSLKAGLQIRLEHYTQSASGRKN